MICVFFKRYLFTTNIGRNTGQTTLAWHFNIEHLMFKTIQWTFTLRLSITFVYRYFGDLLYLCFFLTSCITSRTSKYLITGDPKSDQNSLNLKRLIFLTTKTSKIADISFVSDVIVRDCLQIIGKFYLWLVRNDIIRKLWLIRMLISYLTLSHHNLTNQNYI